MTIAGLRATRISFNAEAVDVTALDSEGGWRELLAGAGVRSAAISGSGVAMGRGPLVADAIKQGTLVYPFEEFAQSQFSYWIVCPHEALKSKQVQSFRTWLHEAAAQD